MMVALSNILMRVAASFVLSLVLVGTRVFADIEEGQEGQGAHKVAQVMDYLNEDEEQKEELQNDQSNEEGNTGAISIMTEIGEESLEKADTSLIEELETKKPSEANLSEGLSIGGIVPIGTVQKGLKIPNLEAGQMVSLIEAEVMTREEEDHLDFEEMTITLYKDDKNGSKEVDYQIDMKVAEFTLQSRLLSGDQATKVSNESFEMTGESLQFDTKAGRGHMTGDIVMRLFDPVDLSNSKE